MIFLLVRFSAIAEFLTILTLSRIHARSLKEPWSIIKPADIKTDDDERQE